MLVAFGLGLTLALAFSSYVRISGDGLSYRKPEIWSNSSLIVLSQASFPEGRTNLPPNAQPDRFSGLADQYAALATSDAVIRSLKQQHLLKADAGEKKEPPISATAVSSTVTGAATPLVQLTAEAKTPRGATRLAIRATATFIRFVRSWQVAANIPVAQRIELRVVRSAGVPKLTKPRSKTTPIIIFLGGITLVVAAAFIRENLRRGRTSRPYSLEAAAVPASDRVLDALRRTDDADNETHPGREADGTSDVGSVTQARWSSGSSG